MEQSNDIHRVSWRNMDVVKTFLQTCVQEVSTNGRSGSSLKPESWSKVRTVLEEIHKVNMTAVEWEEYIKAHPKAKSLQTSPLPFPELCRALFDGAAATGSQGWGPSSTNPRPNVSSADSFPSDIDLFGIEDISAVDHLGGVSTTPISLSQSRASSSISTGERPAKKKKSNSTVSKLEEEMSQVMNIMIQKNEGPSVDDCMEKLDGLGWGQGSSLYLAAIGIICENDNYRKAWMRITENEALIGYIKMIGSKLGFNV